MLPNSESRNTPSSFKGDKLYVGLDVLYFVANTAWSFMIMNGRVDEAMKKIAESPNAGKMSRDVVETWTLAGTGGCSCIFFVIYLFLWMNMFKGKKWAFITMIVLTLIGMALACLGLSGVGMGIAVAGLVTGLIKLVYMFMRLAGKTGPALS